MHAQTLDPRLAAGMALGSIVNMGLTFAQSVRARGPRGAAIFAALGLGLPSLAEWLAINVGKELRHHSRPQLAGVPLNATAGWYTIAHGTFTLTEHLLERAGTDARVRRWVAPAGTALLATSFDLLLDPYGLANGMWEWREDGPYASDIVGINGKHGVPTANFVGWIVLTGGVTLLYGLLNDGRPTTDSPSSKAARDAALLLLPYFLPAAIWMLRRGKARYLLCAAPVAVAMAMGLAEGACAGRGMAPGRRHSR